ncbi:MAG: hypothetical protein ACRC6A_09555 [Fusobacteriaceae bacterium]
MKILVYEIFSQKNIKKYNEIYVMKNTNYVAVLVSQLPLKKNLKIEKIIELKQKLQLNFIEITQNQFLNYIKNNDSLKIKEIKFNNQIELDELDEINSMLINNRKNDLIEKIKQNDKYYYIEGIKIELADERVNIIISKNLELEIQDNSMDRYSDEKLFNILEKNKIISGVVEQDDDIC